MLCEWCRAARIDRSLVVAGIRISVLQVCSHGLGAATGGLQVGAACPRTLTAGTKHYHTLLRLRLGMWGNRSCCGHPECDLMSG